MRRRLWLGTPRLALRWLVSRRQQRAQPAAAPCCCAWLVPLSLLYPPPCWRRPVLAGLSTQGRAVAAGSAQPSPCHVCGFSACEACCIRTPRCPPLVTPLPSPSPLLAPSLLRCRSPRALPPLQTSSFQQDLGAYLTQLKLPPTVAAHCQGLLERHDMSAARAHIVASGKQRRSRGAGLAHSTADRDGVAVWWLSTPRLATTANMLDCCLSLQCLATTGGLGRCTSGATCG